MKLKLLTLLLIAVMILCSGCTQSQSYKQGYDKGYSSFYPPNADIKYNNGLIEPSGVNQNLITEGVLKYSNAKIIVENPNGANQDDLDYAQGYIDGYNAHQSQVNTQSLKRK